MVGKGNNSAVNVRLAPDLLDQVETAAHDAHLDRSNYTRELLTAAVTSGLTLAELCDVIRTAQHTTPALLPAPEKAPRKLGARRKLTGKCMHPVHLVQQYPTQDVCTCGHVVRNR